MAKSVDGLQMVSMFAMRYWIPGLPRLDLGEIRTPLDPGEATSASTDSGLDHTQRRHTIRPAPLEDHLQRRKEQSKMDPCPAMPRITNHSLPDWVRRGRTANRRNA